MSAIIVEFPVWRTAFYQNRLKAAREAGKIAYHRGHKIDQNPYHSDTDFYAHWQDGWIKESVAWSMG